MKPQIPNLNCATCHNPYFNRWFSAINFTDEVTLQDESHNPYFNRWFSAIRNQKTEKRL